MSRLTRYKQESLLTDEGGYYEPDTHYMAIVAKLGKLEDIEAELGCPLDVVFKALKNGIDGYIGVYLECDEYGWHFRAVLTILNGCEIVDTLELKDYKKTWWLSSDLEER